MGIVGQSKSKTNTGFMQRSTLERSKAQRAVEKAVEGWIDEDWPQWAEEMGSVMMRSMFTTLQPSTIGTPAGLGAFCGYLLSFALHVKSGKATDLSLTKSASAVVTHEQLANAYSRMATAITDALGDILQLVKSKLNPMESRAFHTGFTDAFREKCFDDEGLPVKMPLNGRIYHLMCTNWKTVETLQNRAEVHRWLCEEMGDNRVPSVEAVQQICKRFGVRLAGRGHPKK